MAKSTALTLLFLFYFSVTAYAQDLYGDPLPRTIPQNVYDRVAGNEQTDVDGALRHWWLCGHWAQHLEDLLAGKNPDPLPAQPPQEEGGSVCNSQVSWRSDGSVWKPVSEGIGRGRPVIILPCRYNEAKIEVYQGNTRLVGTTSRNYCKNPNAQNPDGRSHHDVNKLARELPNDITVVSTFKDGTRECRKVSNPNNRQE